MPYLSSLPPDASLLNVYKLDMALAQPLIRYQQQLMRGPSPLSVGERELIAAYVSGLNACRFCVGVHTEVAQRFGMDADLLETLVETGPSEDAAGKLAPILDYVGKLTRDPSRMVEADSAAVYAAGWDETALLHAVSICGFFNFFNRLVDGVGIDAAQVDFATLAKGLTEIGYEGRL